MKSVRNTCKKYVKIAVLAEIVACLLTASSVSVVAQEIPTNPDSPATEYVQTYVDGRAYTGRAVLYEDTTYVDMAQFAEGMARGEVSRMRRIATEALETTLSYATVVAVLLSIFSEELGYVFYDSYGAGHYVALMSVVVPIMYLDHVTDSMLKGIGEQVFSMWVNITDSILSVLLVWVLIPRMGIMGYAVVIVAMEGYNFILSVLRLRKRIKFGISPVRAVLLPLVFSLLAARLSLSLFHFSGRATTPWWLFMKMLFALCAFVFFSALSRVIARKRPIAVKNK